MENFCFKKFHIFIQTKQMQFFIKKKKKFNDQIICFLFLSRLQYLELSTRVCCTKKPDINFSDVFCNLSLVTNESKLKKFQYKLLHRALPTNTFLVKIGIKNSVLCNLCRNASDSILHYIWLCPVVKLFWNRIKTWLEEFFDIPIELNMANIVLQMSMNIHSRSSNL